MVRSGRTLRPGHAVRPAPPISAVHPHKQLMLGRASWPTGWDDPILAVGATLLEIAPPLADGFVHVGPGLLVPCAIEDPYVFEPRSQRHVASPRVRAAVKGEVHRVQGGRCPPLVGTGGEEPVWVFPVEHRVGLPVEVAREAL